MKRVSTSAAERLKVLWPDVKAAKAGVTKVSIWYGTHSTARTQRRPPCCVFGSSGFPGQARMAISPIWSFSAAWRRPGRLDSGVITSTRPGTSGRPSGWYAGPFGSEDCPSPPM
ncbi:MAG: hypothetical protein U0802_08745 [Candidatus Binatia bacterium]